MHCNAGILRDKKKNEGLKYFDNKDACMHFI